MLRFTGGRFGAGFRPVVSQYLLKLDLIAMIDLVDALERCGHGRQGGDAGHHFRPGHPCGVTGDGKQVVA